MDKNGETENHRRRSRAVIMLLTGFVLVILTSLAVLIYFVGEGALDSELVAYGWRCWLFRKDP